MDPKSQRVIDTYVAYENAQKAFNEAIQSRLALLKHPSVDPDWKQLIANMAKCKSEFEAAIDDSRIT